MHTVLFLVTCLLLICPLLFGCLFLVVIDWWFPVLNLSSIVEISVVFLYFQDSVLIVPFLLLSDSPVLLHSLLLCFLAAFLNRGFYQDHGHDSHYAGLQDSYLFFVDSSLSYE